VRSAYGRRRRVIGTRNDARNNRSVEARRRRGGKSVRRRTRNILNKRKVDDRRNATLRALFVDEALRGRCVKNWRSMDCGIVVRRS